MFGLKNGSRAETQLETMIGNGSSFQGTLRSQALVRIDGRMEGGLSADGVIVGDNGEIQGDISARTVVVGGKVCGNIHASETLELLKQAQVFGDLISPRLLIAEGAVFEGKCVMSEEKSRLIEVNG
jgi:cytoskeletal protein CcmA (bactofilin family)